MLRTMILVLCSLKLCFAQGGDTCADAAVIDSIPYCDFGTTQGFAADYFNTCNGSGPDVVYRYSPAVNETVRFSLCGSPFDCVLALWHGCPSDGGEQLSCNDDFCGSASCLAGALSAGETYYVIIDGYDGGAGDYQFHAVPVTYGCPAAHCGDVNDRCTGADLITAGTEFPNAITGSTIGAEGDLISDSSSCGQLAGPGVWFQFAGSDSVATVTLPDFTNPHRLFAFCGPCNQLTCIAAPPCGSLQQIDFCTQSGADYYLLVSSCDETGGTFLLNLAYTVLCDTPACTQTPGPPLALTLGRSGANVVLRWRQPSTGEPDHYLIYRSSTPDNITAPEHQIAVRSGRDYTDIGILNAPVERHYYAVTAVLP